MSFVLIVFCVKKIYIRNSCPFPERRNLFCLLRWFMLFVVAVTLSLIDSIIPLLHVFALKDDYPFQSLFVLLLQI